VLRDELQLQRRKGRIGASDVVAAAQMEVVHLPEELMPFQPVAAKFHARQTANFILNRR
jgi:hypothetical protein